MRQPTGGRDPYATAVSNAVELEAARRSYLTAGRYVAARDVVRPEVLASWERSRWHDVDPDRITARFLGHTHAAPSVVACANDVFDAFVKANEDGACSLALLDTGGVVRARCDGDGALAHLLDAVLLVPGYDFAERAVGTTAASIALHEQAGAAISGPEHYHSQLTCLSDAAAPVIDPNGHDLCGVVTVISHHGAETPLQLALARMLAEQIADRIAGEPQRRSQIILEQFDHRDHEGTWVVATDGNFVTSNAAARQLDATDLRALNDLVLASLMLQDFATKHLDLPANGCAEVTTEPIWMSGELIGCLLTGRKAGSRPSPELPEGIRRQGSHVAPLTRRDYAKDVRGSDRAQQEHAKARIRANRELLTPFLRARHEVVASIGQGRNHLLIGEPGVGKRTLVLNQFRQSFPLGRVITVDCATMAGEAPTRLDDLTNGLSADLGDRPHLLLLRGINGLTPVGARRLDEALRPLVALPTPPLVVGSVDIAAVDATRPYGLLLRHFHEITRVPPLRYRLDEVGDIANSVLRKLAARRSLRLSLQVVRVLESYAWPGNISELEDVLRYVVAHKPVGEIQPPDLPQLCFQGRARKMSMLEAAQCDAIIQALYESRGNRYKAAEMLGIARSSLYRKIDAFGISYIA
ncbi:helix-turn-helix domain-containing protein [Amycolatopsis rhabdoformis]|uniref:Helix-turn-helix domain-containing protein n=1 Tax=Amycolatopsis rhabdoformis TaxID=1448059 RepID=A0ABZ1IL29_9PSEU|nr:helix-turn-helix domain-containing protein [Amycolatopsis rhabdoformis]WSE34571.1 helix-turn-helix domain-containing protein [Amycolatopsis rhabdoformis]